MTAGKIEVNAHDFAVISARDEHIAHDDLGIRVKIGKKKILICFYSVLKFLYTA